AQQLLDETFIVLSGDGLTDVDLSQALAFHKAKKAMATLVLTRVENPLEYGVVILGGDGRVCRFLEKPSWGEVFSDTVNTGIYILEPDIFDYIPAATSFDFSKDVFPLLLQDKAPMYGYVAGGYWCDIGTLSQYRQTQFDMLSGLVRVDIAGEEVRPGIWLGENVALGDSLESIKPPVFIGSNTVIEADVRLGEFTVLGDNNYVGSGSAIKHSVVWNHCYLGQRVKLSGTTIGCQAALTSDVSAFEGSVIGDSCTLGVRSSIKPNVKLWPAKEIEQGVTVHTSLVWGEKLSKNLFGKLGISGIANVEFTPDFASKLAAAYGSTLTQGAHIIISSDEHAFSQIIKKSLIAGLLSAGTRTTDLGESVTPVTRFGVKHLRAVGGLHVRMLANHRGNCVLLEFLDQEGMNISRDLERRIENAFVMEDFRRGNLETIGRASILANLNESYCLGLLQQLPQEEIKLRKLKIVLEAPNGILMQLAANLLPRLNCQLITITSTERSLIDLVKLVTDYQADLGVRLNANGEELVLITGEGEIVKEQVMTPLLALIKFHYSPKGVLAVPITASGVIESIASAYG
ncbi:MAG TPA: sugar phosphate nucleotidyltransferase, partial [Bacillota bacterium]|nr:sugar phosphate nucleotidyltransferase [Bacillota bacterium]